MIRQLLSVVFAAIAMFVETASAQSPPRPSPGSGEGVPVSVVVTGCVLSPTGRPLPRVNVTLRGIKSRVVHTLVTDSQGRYAAADLPPDDYMVDAKKDGYLRGFPVKAGTGVPVAVPSVGLSGGRVPNITLQRGGVISGQVVDQYGEPILWATVKAIHRRYSSAGLRLDTAATAETDDLGAFRLFGLVPGVYFVSAVPRSGADVVAPLDSEPRDRTPARSFAPSYYPSVLTLQDATSVNVNAEAETGGVVIKFQPSETATVSGFVSVGAKGPIGVGSVGLIQEVSGGGERLVALTSWSSVSRSFQFANIAPGQYTIVGAISGERSGESWFGRARIEVSSTDQEVTLSLGRPGALHGEVLTDTGQPLRPREVQISLIPVKMLPLLVQGPLIAQADSGGRFRFESVPPGEYVVRVTGTQRWTLEHAWLEGVDASEVPVSVEADGQIAGMRVQLTSRLTEVVGSVSDGSAAISQVLVVVFGSSSADWRPYSRRVAITRSGDFGKFRALGLPPGDYLAVALIGPEAGDVADPSFLGQLADRSTRLVLRPGELVVLDLRALVWPSR